MSTMLAKTLSSFILGILVLGFAACAKKDADSPTLAAPKVASSTPAEVVTGAPGKTAGSADCEGAAAPGITIESGAWVTEPRKNKAFSESARLKFSGGQLTASSTCSSATSSVVVSIKVTIEMKSSSFEIKNMAEASKPFESGLCRVSLSSSVLQFRIRGKCLEISDAAGISSSHLFLEPDVISAAAP